MVFTEAIRRVGLFPFHSVCKMSSFRNPDNAELEAHIGALDNVLKYTTLTKAAESAISGARMCFMRVAISKMTFKPEYHPHGPVYEGGTTNGVYHIICLCGWMSSDKYNAEDAQAAFFEHQKSEENNERPGPIEGSD